MRIIIFSLFCYVFSQSFGYCKFCDYWEEKVNLEFEEFVVVFLDEDSPAVPLVSSLSSNSNAAQDENLRKCVLLVFQKIYGGVLRFGEASAKDAYRVEELLDWYNLLIQLRDRLYKQGNYEALVLADFTDRLIVYSILDQVLRGNVRAEFEGSVRSLVTAESFIESFFILAADLVPDYDIAEQTILTEKNLSAEYWAMLKRTMGVDSVLNVYNVAKSYKYPPALDNSDIGNLFYSHIQTDKLRSLVLPATFKYALSGNLDDNEYQDINRVLGGDLAVDEWGSNISRFERSLFGDVSRALRAGASGELSRYLGLGDVLFESDPNVGNLSIDDWRRKLEGAKMQLILLKSYSEGDTIMIGEVEDYLGEKYPYEQFLPYYLDVGLVGEPVRIKLIEE